MHQSIGDNQVWRSPDKRHHPAHAAGKGQGHQQTAGIRPRACGHAHDDGQHEGDRPGVAHESTDGRRYQHDEEEETQFTRPCQLEDFAAYHLCEPRLENRAAHDEQSDHHDNDGV